MLHLEQAVCRITMGGLLVRKLNIIIISDIRT